MNAILLRLGLVRQQAFLQVFTIYLRYLVGSAFVIAAIGMGKFSSQELLVSKPGAPIETLQPLQQFFRVMATSGLYWKFIGWVQLISGGLLLTQRFAKAGAAMFSGMILNIFIITVSYNFTGTPIITGLMLLAAAYLIVWDLDSFQFMFRNAVKENLPEPRPLSIAGHPFWEVVGVSMLASLLVLTIAVKNIFIELGTAFAEGLLAFLIYTMKKPSR